MFEYLKGQVKNLHNVSELYADNPEEGMRQMRMLLTSTQNRADQFENDHCSGTPSSAKGEKTVRKVLDMRQQLYGDRSDIDLLT